MKSWKKSELKFIKENLNLSDKEFAKQFGVSITAVKTTRIRHDILRPVETWRFNKGHIPINKGKHFNAGGRSVETQFKKGTPTHNEKYDGCISERRDKCGRVYKWIRISKANWKMLHVYLWEKKFGKVPSGQIVIFKNKNSLDARIENLELITRAQHAIRNHNREKAGVSMKAIWSIVKTFEDFGIEHSTIKFRSKRKVA